jgi:hypothetical protein
VTSPRNAARPRTSASGQSRLLLIAIATLAVTSLLAACDGGDGAPGTTPTAVAPTATVSPEQTLLEQAVLQPEDLPANLVQADASTSTNEDVANGEANSEEELARLESWGRLLGYQVDFVPGSGSPAVQDIQAMTSAASLYRTPEGASSSFADDAQKARAADWAASYPDLTSVEVKEVDHPELADEVVWIRVSGLQNGGDGPMFIEDFVVLRRSRMRGFLRMVSLVDPSAGRDALLQDVADLAARQVERIDAAL